MLGKLKDWWNSRVSISEEVKCITNLLESIDEKTHKISTKLEEEYKVLNTELSLYRGLLESIGMAVPDMIWLKDTNGKYLYANKAIRRDLLCHANPLGLTDIELARLVKDRYGENNHTFGEKCANSDAITLERNSPSRFLENGKVKGKMMYLEVFKVPLYDNGNLLGVCGVGRDVTEYVEAYRKSNCKGCTSQVDIFKKYEYQPDTEE